MLLSLRRIGPTWPLLYVLCYCLGVIAFFVAARYRVPVLPVLIVFCFLRGVDAVGLGADEMLAQPGARIGHLLGLCVGGQ